MGPPKYTPLPIKDAYVVTFDRYGDSRGFFNELYNETTYPDVVNERSPWKQVSFSKSAAGVLRGLHCSPYDKFITCTRGALYDVIADFREDSPTFGRWCGVLITESNKKQVLVPAKCGHGFYSVEDDTCALYLQGGCFNPANEADTHPFDKLVAVKWPIPEGIKIELSAKDTKAPELTVRHPHLAGRKTRGRILVIGASGQVGAALVEAWGEENCIGTYSANHVDGMVPFNLEAAATDQELADDLLRMCYPTVVCICAGMTWVDGCESQMDKAMAINKNGPVNVAKAAQKFGAKTVYYSTDYVHDGAEGPYAEGDKINPINVYGQSKLEGEEEILKADPGALILRTCGVYGPEMQGKNFIYQLARKMKAGEEMKCPQDQLGTPTYNRDLAKMTKGLVDAGQSGIFNAVGSECMARTDFAMVACDCLGLDKSTITPMVTKSVGQAAKRPLAGGLKIDKLIAAVPDCKPMTIREALADWKSNPRGKAIGA